VLKDGSKSDRKTMYIDEKKVNNVVSTVVAIINSLAAMGFLIAAVWVLWKVEDFTNKLRVLTGFVVAFALWFGFLTSATRTGVFAATTAYAAVLVVYVSQG
jgi:hypothetical protein